MLFRTTNYGHSWEVISPDLTTNDKAKQQSSGGEIVTDNTAAEFHCTIIAIGPSPVDPNVIWVGTDDGNVQVTRDGGKTWTNTVKGDGRARAERLDQQGRGLALRRGHGLRLGQPLAGRRLRAVLLQDGGLRQDVDEDHRTGCRRAAGRTSSARTRRCSGLLYAGTEFGLYASWDDGATWVSIRNNMPPVAVRDIAIHPRDNDVIVATHGRGIYILDDAAPLQQIGQADEEPTRSCSRSGPAIRWAGGGGTFRQNERDWIAPNPPPGAWINVYLKTRAAGAGDDHDRRQGRQDRADAAAARRGGREPVRLEPAARHARRPGPFDRLRAGAAAPAAPAAAASPAGGAAAAQGPAVAARGVHGDGQRRRRRC
ncbi:MAG: hypothetical protein MZV49_25820 [Rhodopseudomonas palustris]|nr:hypothetical protein [Rhodopseudomonas palustris]